MEKYYENNVSSYINEIGKQRFSFVFKRNAKKAAIWYFGDFFGMTINILSLVWMVI